MIAATTSDPALMIVWRAVLGIAAVTQMPATLGLIFSTFTDPRQRGIAVGRCRSPSQHTGGRARNTAADRACRTHARPTDQADLTVVRPPELGRPELRRPELRRTACGGR
ncbi:hypothetical protein ACFXJ8_06940 [Nonomuraea sp. NPDC059194]|uniref:hypothetical protein n=1 Tax=Nonomuraea sp. NPDC059194 TaxID=3346764 RepID=UPI0036CC0A85